MDVAQYLFFLDLVFFIIVGSHKYIQDTCNVHVMQLLNGRHFYPKRLRKSTFVEGDGNISLWYIKIGIELFFEHS